MPPANDDRFNQEDAVGKAAGAPGRLLADRYELIGEIGSGATATTFRALDQRLGRHVAVKVLRHELASDQTYVQRFEREARTAASINHPNVVDVYDFGQEGDSLFIVMQLIEGEDLKHLIQRTGGIPEDRALGIIRQVLAGLAAIHIVGIVHRDIKPQNVLIGRDGNARLTDFGVAQIAIDMGLTTAGTTVGTAAYMAPEQAQAGTLTEATDMYSVGVMLYEMLTGSLPFSAPTPMAMMLAHIQQDAEPPSERAPQRGISERADWVVMQAMAKQPTDRFRSTTAITRALDGAVPASQESRTTVLPAADRTAAMPVTQRNVPEQAWRATPRAVAASATSLPASASGHQGGSGLQRALGGLVVLGLLVLAAIAGYLVYDFIQGDQNPGGVGDGTDAVTPATSGPPTDNVVATEVPGSGDNVIVPPDPTDVPTDEPAQQPTDTAVPTDEPTQVPTETPVPTDEPTQVPSETPVPTDEPTQTPDPTDVPVPTETPGPTPPPIEPADDDGSGAIGDGGDEEPGSSTGETAMQSVDIPGDKWKGQGIDVDKQNGLFIAGPGDEASASVSLEGNPVGDTVQMTITGIYAGSEQASFSIRVNGGDAGTFESSLPVNADGQEIEFGSMVVDLPAVLFAKGKNEIVFVNLGGQAVSLGWYQPSSERAGLQGQGNSTISVEQGSIIVTSVTVETEVSRS